MVSGIVMMRRNPLDAAAIASPTPVLPEVGSTKTVSLLMRPSFSAFSIIAKPTRSLTLPPGLKDSTLARRVAFKPNSFSMFFNSTSGVLPIVSRMLLWIIMVCCPHQTNDGSIAFVPVNGAAWQRKEKDSVNPSPFVPHYPFRGRSLGQRGHRGSPFSLCGSGSANGPTRNC